MPAYEYKKGGKKMWYAKVNFQDTEGINRQHCKRGFKTRKDAEAYETEYKAALKLCPQKGVQSLSEVLQAILDAHNIKVPVAVTEPVQEPQKQRTFQDIFDEYWATTDARGLTEGTKETKANMYKQHILPYFGAYAITDITASVVQEWQAVMKTKERRGKPFSDTYLHSIQSQLNAVLNYAVRKAYLPFSPMVDLKNMGQKNAPPREFWTVEEYGKFAEYAQQRNDTFMVFELCYWLGLRRGEALGIRPMDITYDNRRDSYTLHIATSVDAKRRVGNTKTASSDRIITLPETLKHELDTYMEQSYGLQPTDRIFEHVSISTLNRDKAWAIEQSGVPYVCVHGMRHGSASNLISSNKLTATDVARWLGHSSAKTTLRTYSHILPETEVMAADYIEAMRSKI